LSSGEILLLFLFAIPFAVMVLLWYANVFSWAKLLPRPLYLCLACLPVFLALPIVAVLKTLASWDVVTSGAYITFYTFFGMFWVMTTNGVFFRFYNISTRDDAIERRNPAAFIAVAGGMLASDAIYCGANVGDGPGWWCVLVAGGLGMLTWHVLTKILFRLTSADERITVDRNAGCALRYAGYMIACGILLARASAGDWHSFAATVVEFADGWPALAVTALAVVLERAFLNQERESTFRSRSIPRSLLFGALFIAAALAYVLTFPPGRGMFEKYAEGL